MSAPWGSVDDLITRVEAMDEDAADLREDVVSAFGDDEEASRAARDAYASIQALHGVLIEARGAGGVS